RIWRLVHEDMPKAPHFDMNKLEAASLAKEVGSSYYWRRQTARRLLVDYSSKKQHSHRTPSTFSHKRLRIRPVPETP
ncbi:MAG: hypothetical protein O3B25_10770, partial [Verrucomicrobia bacterium]|nr:hypothetical protein [Verrucomicrobiota bacterium]